MNSQGRIFSVSKVDGCVLLAAIKVKVKLEAIQNLAVIIFAAP